VSRRGVGVEHAKEVAGVVDSRLVEDVVSGVNPAVWSSGLFIMSSMYGTLAEASARVRSG